MKIIVLTTNSEEKSARRLGYETHTYFPYEYRNLDDLVVLRIGNGYQDAPIENPIFDDYDDFKNVINPQKNIELNVNKPEMLKVLSKVVPTPNIFSKKVPRRTLAVYRPTQHSSGNGFNVAKGPFLIKEGMYATQFIKTNKEHRVFVCGGYTLACSREKAKKADSDICRSNWKYTKFRRANKRLKSIALKASKAIGLEICALDILQKGRKYYVLETNAAPTFEGKATEFYKKNIPILIKKKFPHLFAKGKTKPVNKVGRLVKLFTNK